jgi:ABC-type bacteriocin/lantibiotic exporter with double-glycine peptidase domain
MILSYHGRETSVTECREACDVGRDGLTALTIARAARAYGLRVKAYTLEPSDLGSVALPAILHWNFNHFVVLERWSPKGVGIVDPAIGRCSLSTTEFDASFTGVALTLEPSIHFRKERAGGQGPHLRYLKAALQTPGTLRLLGQILAASLLLTLAGLAVPVLTKVLVDEVLPLRINEVLPILAGGVFVVAFAQMVASYLRAALMVYLQARLDSQMMLGFFEHVLALPFKFFQRRTSGDILMRLGSNATVRDMLSSQMLSVVLDGGLALVYAVVLLVMAPLFGALALGIGFLQVAILLVTTRKMHALMQKHLSARADSEGYLVEALNGIATLKAAGAEHRALDHWSNLFFKQLNASSKKEHLAAVVSSVTTTLGAVSPLLLLLVGAFYVLENRITLGTMLALSAIATSFLTPLASLVSSGQQLQLVGAYLERIADVAQAEREQSGREVRPAPPLSGSIELRDVSFRYDSNAPWVLHAVSVTIERGQKVALVGRTGSGKSTLAKLLLGLYEPTVGKVSYDGIPLEQLDYRTLRGQFGVVLQETSVFSGSIRQNIAFADPSIPYTRVTDAAKLAAIHDEIMQMPMQYETLVAEGGAALSGGQRQRLSLARALSTSPTLLLLDEATSHLDTTTERLVNENVSALECTQVVIAHRLSTVRDADVILVLDQGEIVERGSHKELLARNGHYTALIGDQVEAAQTPETTGLIKESQYCAPSVTDLNGADSKRNATARMVTGGEEDAM